MEPKANGRPRKTALRKRPTTAEPIKPTVSGQLEISENVRLDEIAKDAGRSRSYLVRAAIVLLIREHAANRIDLSRSIESLAN